MSADKKDLTYFLAHPDEMPEDPKELERLTNEHMQQAMESGAEQLTVDRFVPPDEKKDKGAPSDAKVEEAAKPAEAEVKTEAKVEAKAEEKKAEAAPAKVDEAKPDGILAKDGKNVIPYGQLESARQRATTAETLVKAQAEEIGRLKAEKKPASDVADVEMLTEEELKVLEADSPTLAKVIRSQQTSLRALTDKVQSVEETQAERAAAEDAAVKSEVQTAIDANPALAAWQTAEDQTMWNRAHKFDVLLREDPQYAEVSFAERFAKVVELTQSTLAVETSAPAKVEEAKPAPTVEETRAAAEAKLKEKAKTAKPVSLSQIPGGAPPAVDEREKVEQMSPVALGQQFLSMSAEQREAYLASL